MEIASASPSGLVDQIRAGSRAAEEELVSRYRRGIRFLLGRSVSDRTASDDLFQETFRLALEKIRAGEVRDPARLSGFMCGLARNLSANHFGRRKLQLARNASSQEAEGDPAEPSALDELVRREQAAFAHRVLAELPSERDRQILQRFYVADDTKDDICESLGVSSLHFNQILFRARERFRKLFEALEAEE